MMNIQYEDGFKKKGYVSVSDGDAIEKIDRIARLFGIPICGRGGIRRRDYNGNYRYKGAAVYPSQDSFEIWWPMQGNSRSPWHNEFYDSDTIVHEYHIDEAKSRSHVEGVIRANRQRVVWAHRENGRGGYCYKFVGVFKLNAEESRRLNKAVWERVADKFELASKQFNGEAQDQVGV